MILEALNVNIFQEFGQNIHRVYFSKIKPAVIDKITAGPSRATAIKDCILPKMPWNIKDLFYFFNEKDSASLISFSCGFWGWVAY